MIHNMWLWAKRGLFAVLAVTLLVATAALGFLIWEKHRLAQFSRTHERPLPVKGNHLLGKLKPVSSRNSLQFSVKPSFDDREYTVYLFEENGKGLGEALIAHRDGQLVSHRSFSIPLADFNEFLERWDSATDGYNGEGRVWADGNHLAFERIRGTRVTSGDGNSPCHYDVLGDWAAQNLTAYVPELADLRAPWLPIMLISETCNRGFFSLR